MNLLDHVSYFSPTLCVLFPPRRKQLLCLKNFLVNERSEGAKQDTWSILFFRRLYFTQGSLWRTRKVHLSKNQQDINLNRRKNEC